MSNFSGKNWAAFAVLMWVVWYGGRALLLAGAAWAGWTLGGWLL